MPTICELQGEAKSRGLKGYSKLNKAGLMALVNKSSSPAKEKAKDIVARLRTTTERDGDLDKASKNDMIKVINVNNIKIPNRSKLRVNELREELRKFLRKHNTIFEYNGLGKPFII